MPRLLLIDDDRMQNRLITEAVRSFREPFFVDWVEDYDSGLEKLSGGSYDVCLLDYGLGDRNGLELLKAAISKGCRTPVVMLTANSDHAVDDAALEAGALDYLVKGEVTPVLLERSIRYSRKLAGTLGQLKDLASLDQLTGLLNRREFNAALSAEWERHLRYGTGLALVLVDLDNFKAINDTHGHAGGDEVLTWVSRILKSNVRTVDRCFRFGGDEFACLLSDSDESQAAHCGARIVSTLADLDVPLSDGRRASVRVSAGGAGATPGIQSTDALIRAADAALYEAKRRGRNQAVVASQVAK
jgi:two-component system, cell cycle response regulator